jgi:TonB family protein
MCWKKKARETTVAGMVIMRFVFIIAIFALVVPMARAAEKTTAVWSDGHSSSLSDEELLQYALASPGPAYPEEAQKARVTGSGLYELRINRAGATTEIVIIKSSGSAVLDQAAKSTFLKWRFKPAVFSRVRVPVSWSVNRVR